VKKAVYSILVKPVLTEKTLSGSQEGGNTYCFEVARAANKIEIRKAVEQAFKVKVAAVRTASRHGGTRRFGYKWVKEPSVKRAYVTLAEGSRIDIL